MLEVVRQLSRVAWRRKGCERRSALAAVALPDCGLCMQAEGLMPGQECTFRVRFNPIEQGAPAPPPSPSATFHTLAHPPARPAPPVLVERFTNALMVRGQVFRTFTGWGGPPMEFGWAWGLGPQPLRLPKRHTGTSEHSRSATAYIVLFWRARVLLAHGVTVDIRPLAVKGGINVPKKIP